VPAARHFTYTVPSAIEGEPADVAKIATQQIGRLAAVVAELSKDTYIQLRSAGIDPDDDNPVEAWLNTKPGQAAADLIWAARVFAEAARAL
jgi:hypothetical protein